MTDFDDLRDLLVQRAGAFQVAVLVGPGASHTLPHLQQRWRGQVLDADKVDLRGQGDVSAFTNARQRAQAAKRSTLLVVTGSLLDDVIAGLLAEPWPVTVVETSADPDQPVLRVSDRLRGRRFDVLVRAGELLERHDPEVRVITAAEMDFGPRFKTSGRGHIGPWEDVFKMGMGNRQWLEVEVLDPRWDDLPLAALETAATLLTDAGAGASLSAALSAAAALEEEK